MAHLATMMQGFHPLRKNDDGVSEDRRDQRLLPARSDTPYPLGQIQSQGRTHGVMAQTVVPWVPLWAYEWWVARGVDWLAMTEDLPRAENRVTVDVGGQIRLHVPAEQPVGAHRAAGEGDHAASCIASASGR